MESLATDEQVKLPSKFVWILSKPFLGRGYTYNHYVYDWCERWIVDYAKNHNGIGPSVNESVMKLYSKLKRGRDDRKEAHVS